MGQGGSLAEGLFWPSCNGDTGFFDRHEASDTNGHCSHSCGSSKSPFEPLDSIPAVSRVPLKGDAQSNLSFLPWAEPTTLHKPLLQPGGFIMVHGGESRNSFRTNFVDLYDMLPRPLGRGTYGEVLAAMGRKNNMRRAVKSVRKGGSKGDILLIRREADILSQLDHPNVVRLHQIIESSEKINLIFEVCDGGDLRKYLNNLSKPVSESEAAALLWQMLSAVLHLHARGVVHRDLKPEHFMFLQKVTDDIGIAEVSANVKLIDFGLARATTNGGDTGLSPRVGSAKFMSPEATDGTMTSTFADRADVWSLGIILHVLLLINFPRATKDARSSPLSKPPPAWERLSNDARDLLMRMLDVDAQTRPDVKQCLKHPWIASVDQETKHHFNDSAPAVRKAISTFADATRFRRLALLAVAWELESKVASATCAKPAYQTLEVLCGGSLTRQSLAHAAKDKGQVGLIAADLIKFFDAIDVTGSNSLEWTEFVAVMLSVGSDRDGDKAVEGDFVPVLAQEQVCQRAFYLLSQEAEFITAASLDSFLNPSRQQPASPRSTRSHGSRSSLSHRNSSSHKNTLDLSQHAVFADYDSMILEVAGQRSMDFVTFCAMLMIGVCQPPPEQAHSEGDLGPLV